MWKYCFFFFSSFWPMPMNDDVVAKGNEIVYFPSAMADGEKRQSKTYIFILRTNTNSETVSNFKSFQPKVSPSYAAAIIWHAFRPQASTNITPSRVYVRVCVCVPFHWKSRRLPNRFWLISYDILVFGLAFLIRLSFGLAQYESMKWNEEWTKWREKNSEAKKISFEHILSALLRRPWRWLRRRCFPLLFLLFSPFFGFARPCLCVAANPGTQS